MPTSKQRRAAEQRRLRRQAERRSQQAARRRRLNVILSVVGTLVILGVVVTLIAVTSGSDSSAKPGAARSSTPTGPTTKPASSTPASTKASASAATKASTRASTATSTKASPSASTPRAAVTATCTYPRSGTAARKVSTPPTTADAKGTVAVRLATSRGAMTFTLNRAAAPCAVNSFVSLARQKFYNGTSCHRLVTKSIFLLQCGDPTGTGRGGPGYKFADELGTNPVFRRGAVVMANGGPNTNGSQFFIIDRDTTLGAAYTPLGTVTSGLAVADRVYRAGTSDTSTDGPPKLRLTFRTVTVS